MTLTVKKRRKKERRKEFADTEKAGAKHTDLYRSGCRRSQQGRDNRKSRTVTGARSLLHISTSVPTSQPGQSLSLATALDPV